MFTEGFAKLLIGFGTGIIFFGIILFCNQDSLFQFDEQIKADKIGQLGDFIGGIAGSMWALAGVILFYVALQSQKDALADQKEATQATIRAVSAQNESIKLQIEELTLQRNEMAKSTDAQNKSQIALNEQLKSMQQSSQIEILNKYMEIIKNKGLKEHENACQRIISFLSSKIFSQEEYYNFVSTELKVRLISAIWVSSKKERYNYTVHLTARNSGCKINTINSLSDIEIKQIRPAHQIIAENSALTIKFTEPPGKYIFEILFEGQVLNKQYKQVLTVENQSCNLSEIEIIK